MRKYIWNIITKLYPFYLKKIYKMKIAKNVRISHKATLDKSINPEGITIGNNTWVLAGAIILAHDHSRGIKLNTIIGSNCVIGMNSIILPGITIGNHVFVGAGCVVTKNIENNSIFAGNPGRIIKKNILINDNGQILN